MISCAIIFSRPFIHSIHASIPIKSIYLMAFKLSSFLSFILANVIRKPDIYFVVNFKLSIYSGIRTLLFVNRKTDLHILFIVKFYYDTKSYSKITYLIKRIYVEPDIIIHLVIYLT